MNTPRTRKPKRYSAEKWHKEFWREGRIGNGQFGLSIANVEVASQVGHFVSTFPHLEEMMENFAAVVLGTDPDIATHVMRSIISAKARMDFLRDALERGQRNSERPAKFDEVLDEFKAINDFRNDLVHAKYQTNMETGDVSWVRPRGDPMLLRYAAFEPFDHAEIDAMKKRGNALVLKISIIMGEEQARLQASSQQSSEKTPAPDQPIDPVP